MWPTFWLLRRESTCDVTVDGYSIPTGSETSISPYISQRSAPDFLDPGHFRPQPWEGPSPHAGAYLPFGAGPSWCVAAPLVEAELALGMPAMADRFTFTRSGSLDVTATDSLRPTGQSFNVAHRAPRLSCRIPDRDEIERSTPTEPCPDVAYLHEGERL